MKTTLIAVALLASQLCSAQRIREITNASWKFPDLSIEVKGDFVYSGFTELNPSTGRLAPVFKRNTPTGGPGPAFFINFSDNVLLMDFVIRQPTNTIVLAGMISPSSSGVAPYKMVIVEWDYGTNTILKSYYVNTPNTMIPHQVIVSETASQVVVVGTEVFGTMNSANYSTIAKSGFVLGVDLPTFTSVVINRRMDTPLTGSNDSDMLETVTEVPGTGYFAAGSGNGPSNEQNTLNMGVTYGNAVMFNNQFDNTNSRAAGASVAYSPVNNTVYMLANSSVIHQFQVAQCNPFTGLPLTPFISHQITSLPIGSGIDQNGFRLMVRPGGQLMLGGYLSSPGSALPQRLTPYIMVLDPNLAYMNGRHYTSGNNAPLSDYFYEGGNSVYINTPDIISFNTTAAKAYIVNQDDLNGGFDLNISANAVNGCEKVLTITSFSSTPPATSPAVFASMPVTPVAYASVLAQRSINQSPLCQQLAASAIQFTVAPNPASDKVTVSLGEEARIVSAAVYDLKGNKVAEAKGSERTPGEIAFDLSELNAGMYVIMVTDESGTAYSEKFVKQ
jgi:hypothetical protein